MTGTTTARPALLVTADVTLAGEVSRLAAAAGVRLGVVADPAEVVPVWTAAAAVLVGPDQAERLASAPPPRRPEIHVVATGPVPDTVYRSALRIGAASVLELPGAAPWLLRTLGDLCEEAADPGRSVAVVGASGGAGASVFAAALATVAARGGAEVLLLDLDPLGPGQRLLVGHEEVSGVCWQDLTVSAGRLGAAALRDAVPRRDRLGVLGWSGAHQRGVPAGLAAETLAAAVRGHAWAVLDVPRHPSDGLRSLVTACDHVVVVAHARTAGLASAARFTHAVRDMVPAAGLVVRTHRTGPVPEEVAGALGLEPWAILGEERRLDEHLALGLGVVASARRPLARAANQVLDRCRTMHARAAVWS